MEKIILLFAICLLSFISYSSDSSLGFFDTFNQIKAQDSLVSWHYAKLCRDKAERSGEQILSIDRYASLEELNLVKLYTQQFSKKIVNLQNDIQKITIPAHHLLILAAKDCEQATDFFNQKESLLSAQIQLPHYGQLSKESVLGPNSRWENFRNNWNVSLNWGVHRVFWSPVDLHIMSTDGTDLNVENAQFVDEVSLQWFKFWEQKPADSLRFLDEPQNSFTLSFYNSEKAIELIGGYHHHRLRLKSDSNYYEGHEFLDGKVGPGQVVSVSGQIQGQSINGDINLNDVLSQYRISNGLNRVFIGANKVFTLQSGKMGDLRLKAGGSLDTFIAISNSVLYNDLTTVHEGAPRIGGVGVTGNLTVQFVSKWGVGAYIGGGASGYKINKIPIYNGYINHSFSTFTTLEAGVTVPILSTKRYKRKNK